MMLLRISVYWESWATMVTTAFRPSVFSCWVVSAGVPNESNANESVASVSVSMLRVSIRVLSGCEIYWPDTETAENIVKNSEMKEKITETYLKLNNEKYFCKIKLWNKIN